MNAYDQLQEIREELEDRGARTKTLSVVDRAITLAEPQSGSAVHVSQAMILRHLLKMRDSLDDEEIHMDFLALAGDLDERRRAPTPDEVPDATVDADKRPQHSHKFYREKKREETKQKSGS